MQILSTEKILILRDVTDGDAHETLPNAKNGALAAAIALGTTNNLILVGTIDGGSDLTIPAGGSVVLFKTGSGWWSTYNTTTLVSLGAVTVPISAANGGTGDDLSGLSAGQLAEFDGTKFAGSTVLLSGGGVLLSEESEPAAPADSKVVLFAMTAGGGKTKLMARFPSGASQQVALEP